MLVIIDNYDSFTYNLVDLFARHIPIEVIRNDHVSAEQLRAMPLKGLVISPGPGRPEDSGISLTFVEKYLGEVPIFGVCLGLQIIGQVLGGTVEKARLPMHGKTSLIYHHEKSIFQHLPSPLQAMRYHSLLLKERGLPHDLEVIARTQENEIMAIQHPVLQLIGVQFHPESILSNYGDKMVENWLESLHL